jgi:hypothetical protein
MQNTNVIKLLIRPEKNENESENENRVMNFCPDTKDEQSEILSSQQVFLSVRELGIHSRDQHF